MIRINRIYNEDCIGKKGMCLIDDKSIDMILCDLPYGTTACSWDTIIPFEPLWEQYKRIIKDKGAIVLFGSEPFSSKLRMSNLSQFKYDWIWDKVRPSGFQIAKYVPMKRHEIISVFCKGTPNWNPQKERQKQVARAQYRRPSGSSPLAYQDGKMRIYNDKGPQSILVYTRETGKKYIHPTQKPSALCSYLIRTYTNEGEVVLDNCMGSGTTAEACIKNNRNFIGFETEKKYYDIANIRIKALQWRLF